MRSERRMRMGRRIGIGALIGMAVASARPAPATDGVIEINQVAALAGDVSPGDTPGFPVELFSAGSYRLTSDLVVPQASPAGIAAYVEGTRIDLNGFTIRSNTTCPGSPPACSPIGSGIGIDASGARDVGLRNGRIVGFGVYGVSLFEASHVEDLAIESNGLGGIVCDTGCAVRRSTVRSNGGAGITAGTASRVSESTIQGNAGAGISAPSNLLSDRNLVTQNGGGFPAPRSRRFYLGAPPGGVRGNAAATACSAGFHLASLFEILDPSNLTYDRELGFTQPSAGSGPPAVTGVGGYAWLRGGNTDCSNWTTTSGNGYAASLYPNWATTPPTTWPWILVTLPCNTASPVWCVED